MHVHVAKCHACHAKSRGDHDGANWEPSAPPEPAQCHKCHACHAECTSRSPSATPATQSDGRCRQVPTQTAAASTAPNGNQARHQSQPSPMSATPATKSDDRCHQVPRLPRKVMIDVAKRHACHANSGGVHGAKRKPSAPPEPAQCHKCHACHAK